VKIQLVFLLFFSTRKCKIGKLFNFTSSKLLFTLIISFSGKFVGIFVSVLLIKKIKIISIRYVKFIFNNNISFIISKKYNEFPMCPLTFSLLNFKIV